MCACVCVCVCVRAFVCVCVHMEDGLARTHTSRMSRFARQTQPTHTSRKRAHTHACTHTLERAHKNAECERDVWSSFVVAIRDTPSRVHRERERGLRERHAPTHTHAGAEPNRGGPLKHAEEAGVTHPRTHTQKREVESER